MIEYRLATEYDVENKVLQQAARQDYDSFALDELKDREAFFYPPFAQMLKMTVWDKDEGQALALAKKVTTFLQAQQLEGKLNDILVLGPFPGLVAKVRDMYRFNILVKAKDMQPVKDALLDSEFREQRNLFFDVDPVNVI